MIKRVAATIFALSLASQTVGVAWADNPMGYRLLGADQAASLPRGGGTIGVDVGRAERITSNDLTFDLLRVQKVKGGSAGARAGIKAGDEIVAADGQVFQSVAAFAAYVGSKQPGSTVTFDTLPSGGGPQQAQRVSVTLGGRGSSAAAAPAESKGLSTGTKVAIGVGAAALFGCYKFGCFRSRARQGQNFPAR